MRPPTQVECCWLGVPQKLEISLQTDEYHPPESTWSLLWPIYGQSRDTVITQRLGKRKVEPIYSESIAVKVPSLQEQRRSAFAYPVDRVVIHSTCSSLVTKEMWQVGVSGFYAISSCGRIRVTCPSRRNDIGAAAKFGDSNWMLKQIVINGSSPIACQHRVAIENERGGWSAGRTRGKTRRLRLPFNQVQPESGSWINLIHLLMTNSVAPVPLWFKWNQSEFFRPLEPSGRPWEGGQVHRWVAGQGGRGVRVSLSRGGRYNKANEAQRPRPCRYRGWRPRAWSGATVGRCNGGAARFLVWAQQDGGWQPHGIVVGGVKVAPLAGTRPAPNQQR